MLPEHALDHLTRHESAAVWNERLASSTERIKGSSDPVFLSDHAAILVRLGRLDDAILLLEDVEKRTPGNYYVAANLGTALELKGDLAGAMRWIAVGIRRNPESHSGTEWLHVKILEARLALERDPHWLETHSVLGIDFGSQPKPVSSNAPLKRHLGHARRALEYQLHERMSFVSPPDPVVGDLLFDLSNICALTFNVEHAQAVLALAFEYGVPKPALAELRSQAYAQITSTGAWQWVLRRISILLPVAVVALALLGLAGWLLRSLRLARR